MPSAYANCSDCGTEIATGIDCYGPHARPLCLLCYEEYLTVRERYAQVEDPHYRRMTAPEIEHSLSD